MQPSPYSDPHHPQHPGRTEREVEEEQGPGPFLWMGLAAWTALCIAFGWWVGR